MNNRYIIFVLYTIHSFNCILKILQNGIYFDRNMQLTVIFSLISTYIMFLIMLLCTNELILNCKISIRKYMIKKANIFSSTYNILCDYVNKYFHK